MIGVKRASAVSVCEIRQTLAFHALQQPIEYLRWHSGRVVPVLGAVLSIAQTIHLLELPPHFLFVAEAAVIRAQYLFPEAEIRLTENGVSLQAGPDTDLNELVKQVRYTFYREYVAHRDRHVRELVADTLFR